MCGSFRNGHYTVLILLSVALWACGAIGCERIKGIMENLPFKKKTPVEKSGALSDRDRIRRKFGEPHEKIGIGRTVHTEHGIRYNRKWTYYYSSRTPDIPSMRTVYFIDKKFSGSVIRQPDGTVIEEKIKFLY